MSQDTAVVEGKKENRRKSQESEDEDYINEEANPRAGRKKVQNKNPQKKIQNDKSAQNLKTSKVKTDSKFNLKLIIENNKNGNNTEGSELDGSIVDENLGEEKLDAEKSPEELAEIEEKKKDRESIPFIDSRSKRTSNKSASKAEVKKVETEGNINGVISESNDNKGNVSNKQDKRTSKAVNIASKRSEDIGHVVDIQEMKTKDKLTNSETLLCLIEICLNGFEYGIKYSNKSRMFWDEVYKLEEFENIVKNFKPETFRKYWRILADTGKIEEVVKVIMENVDVINQDNLK